MRQPFHKIFVSIVFIFIGASCGTNQNHDTELLGGKNGNGRAHMGSIRVALDACVKPNSTTIVLSGIDSVFNRVDLHSRAGKTDSEQIERVDQYCSALNAGLKGLTVTIEIFPKEFEFSGMYEIKNIPEFSL